MSYEIGIPKAGQIEGTSSVMNSSLVIFTDSFLIQTAFHNLFKGYFLRLDILASRILSLFLIRYSRIYSRFCSCVFTPCLRLFKSLFWFWHGLQTFVERPPQTGNIFASFSALQLTHNFIAGLTYEIKCKTVILTYSCECVISKNTYLKHSLPPRPERRGFAEFFR